MFSEDQLKVTTICSDLRVEMDGLPNSHIVEMLKTVHDEGDEVARLSMYGEMKPDVIRMYAEMASAYGPETRIELGGGFGRELRIIKHYDRGTLLMMLANQIRNERLLANLDEERAAEK